MPEATFQDMYAGGAHRTAGLPAALVQVTTAVAAHVAAGGCLPTARGVAVAVPASVAVVLLLSMRLRGRPLLLLGGGQLATHALLAAAVACSGHAAEHGAGHVPMTLSHVLALVICRAAVDRTVVAIEQGCGVLRALGRRLARPLSVPALAIGVPSVLSREPGCQLSRGRLLRAVAPVRGPPPLLHLALPA